MKTFSKVVVAIGCTLLVIGLMLALVSMALGGNLQIIANRLNDMGVSNIYRDNYSSWNHHNDDFDYEVWPQLPAEPIAPAALAEPGQPIAPPSVSPYEILRLNLDFAAGDIEIISGDDFELIYGNDDSRRFFYERRNGDTWDIGSRQRNWQWFDFWRYDRNDLNLTVVLPYDFVAEQVTIIMGAGNLQVQGLSAHSVNLEAGVSNCQIGSLWAGTALLEVGLGNLEVRRFHATESKLEVGLGNVELQLAQPLEQYGCNLDVGLGSVTLGNNTYSGVAKVYAGSAESPYRFDINCGLGSVQVREPLTVNL